MSNIESQLTVSVVVPAYNEAERIGPTLQRIVDFFSTQSIPLELVVVDDGSSDQTVAVVEGLRLPGVVVMSYGGNRGKGYAVHYGVTHARGDWVLFADADNSTPIEEFSKLWNERDRYQVIIGSRYLAESNIVIKQNKLRVFISRSGSMLTRFLLLPGIKDTQCGFKLFSNDAVRDIFQYQTVWRWGFDMEILRIAKEHGYQIKEVPVRWYNDEGSKIHSSRVFFATLSELLTIKKNSLLGRYNRRNRSEVAMISRFAMVGAVGTFFDFTVLNLLHAGFGVNLYASVTTGFLIGAINNYLLNSYWSFGEKPSLRKFQQFLLIALVGLVLNNSIVYVFSGQFGWNYNVAKLLAVAIVFVWNYGANRRVTFKGDEIKSN
jgi:dolichyl-phosphate beta-glucosyltransferase